MKNICVLLFTYTLIFLSKAEPDKKKFPLCKICTCEFDANDTKVDVTCDKIPQYHIFQDYFWMINTTNNKSVPAPYNTLTINNNQFISFAYNFPQSNLTVLNLANNAIYNISNSIFKNLQKMKVLILSYNELTIIHPDTFKGVYTEGQLFPLRSLRELRLDHNKLHTLKSDIFEHSEYIEILDLSFNPLQTIDAHTLLAIDSLAFLKELYLQYTEIQTLPDNMLHTPLQLQILDLSGNVKIKEIPSTFEQAKNLQKLYLNNTGFVNLTRKNGFPLMPSVKVLHLCRNEHLYNVGKFALGGLTHLTDLRMSDNIHLESIHELALANNTGGVIWPPIKKLYIGNNKLAYLESDLVARWDALSELDIRDNSWTCECENQWMIDDLMGTYIKINEKMAKQVMCAAPVEMNYLSFYDIYSANLTMRCLDLYGNRPEKDGTLLVGILVGVLLTIPLILFIVFAYHKRWFSIREICDKTPASYSRRFYDSTPNDDF